MPEEPLSVSQMSTEFRRLGWKIVRTYESCLDSDEASWSDRLRACKDLMDIINEQEKLIGSPQDERTALEELRRRIQARGLRIVGLEAQEVKQLPAR